MEKTAIIIGASSGIGKALAEILSKEDYTLGLTGRRVNLLDDLANTLPNKAITKEMDVSDPLKAKQQFEELIGVLGNVDLVIVSAGTGHHNPELEPALELETINTNVSGFTTIAGAAYNHFKKNKKGHLVGISSILTLRGNAGAPAYNASKAFMSNYMEGLRLKALKENLDIHITDIRPGYVDTAMAEGDHMFWVAPPEKAAKQIVDAIKSNKSCAYITKRWRLIAWLMRIAPNFLYKKL